MSQWNICALTGNIIEQPVINKKTGHIFEKRIIEKHIESMSTCPITGQDLSLEDLIPLQTNKLYKPRPINSTSIPQMLTIFQSEWDNIMLETYQLKNHLEVVRNELSHALYQHDAACRVISKIIKERDEAREQLSSLQIQLNSFNYNLENQNNENQQKNILPEYILNEVNESAIHLNAKRKELKKKKNLAFENFANQNQVSQFNLRKENNLNSSIYCLDIDSQDSYIALGCQDNKSYVYDIKKDQIIQSLQGHTDKINEIKFLQNNEDNLKIFSCSNDNKAHLIQLDLQNNQQKIKYTINSHNEAITSLDIHPIGYMGVVCAKDHSWSFHDFNKGQQVGLLNDFDSNLQFGSIKFHPDGHLLGSGTNEGTVKIWNITDDVLMTTLEGHKGLVDNIDFSENGYYLASKSTEDQVVKIWDLRQLNIIHEIDSNNQQIGLIKFDPSGQYLSVSMNNELKIYNTKTWELFTNFKAHKDLVTSFKFGNYSKFLVSASLDKNFNIYS